MTKVLLQPLLGQVDIGDAVVEPESNLRERLFDFHNGGVIASDASDGVKVGNIKGREWVDCHDASHDVDRIARACKGGLDWAVKFSPAASRVNYYSALKVNDRNDFHANFLSCRLICRSERGLVHQRLLQFKGECDGGSRLGYRRCASESGARRKRPHNSGGSGRRAAKAWT